MTTNLKIATAATVLIAGEALRAPVKDFSLSKVLIEELYRRFIGGKERAYRAKKTAEGSIPCSTCDRTISANRVQCLVCRNMSEFLLLAISRSDKTRSAVNPAAETRITELQALLAQNPLALIGFVANLLKSYPQAKYEDVRDSVFALLFTGRAVNPIVMLSEPCHVYQREDFARADNEGMAHA